MLHGLLAEHAVHDARILDEPIALAGVVLQTNADDAENEEQQPYQDWPHERSGHSAQHYGTGLRVLHSVVLRNGGVSTKMLSTHSSAGVP
ncbi:hypothetical protein GCM10027287_44140 [Bordetella muralis]